MKKDKSKERQEYTNQLDLKEPKWFAIYANFKREKLVNKMLKQKGIQCYLPLKKVTRRYARKIRTIELPLISCYLFVKITKEEYIRVLETEHVLKFIRIGKNLLSISEEEIDIIRKVTGEGLPLEVNPDSFSKGDLVEIISGNLVGTKGRLSSIEGKKLFSIHLENLGYSLSIKVDPSILRRINEPSFA